MERRRFITGALAASGLAGLGGAAHIIRAQETPAATPPSQPDTPQSETHAQGRIDGRVLTTDGVPLERVVVSDGYSVVATDATGRFELPARADAAFVFVSTPSGYQFGLRDGVIAQVHRPITPEEILFELIPRPTDDRNHAFIVLADPQTETSEELALFRSQTVPDVAQSVVRLGAQPIFGVADGDILWDHLELFPEYERCVQAMGIPFFQVLGNHDMDVGARTDEASAATFSARYGPLNFSFNLGLVHYVVLDDVFCFGDGYMGYLTDGQLRWLAADLAFVEHGAPVVIFTHIPTLSTHNAREGKPTPDNNQCITNRAALYEVLAPFDVTILAGHTHENEHLFEANRHEHVIGAACGAWWQGPLCTDGAPNGYAVYEVEGTTIRGRYKSTGFPADYQMRVYLPGADPEHPGALIVNVWDWNPRWKVEWSEDGQPRGAMRQYTGYDPEARQLYENPTLALARTWVKPNKTAHLFNARPTFGAKQITVQATDEQGRVYRESIDL